MKKTVALLLALLMLLCGTLSFADEIEEATEETAQEAATGKTYDTMTVGTINMMSGNFFGNIYTSTTSDCDVQKMLHAYALTKWDNENGVFEFDETVVTGIAGIENADGSHTYYVALNSALAFSDGTPITAKDYAFSVLLMSCPEIAGIGAVNSSYNYLKGWEDYANGTSDVFTGVGIVDDTMVTFTIAADALPNFFELGLLTIVPYPISVIAPGCKVEGDANGTRICDEDGQDTLFTAELLQKTMLDEATGYVTHPSVVSGPYTLTSYEDQRAVFKINPYYIGNADLVKPLIENVIFIMVERDNMINELSSGAITLINKAVLSDSVLEGIALVREGGYNMSNYSRSGCSFISFCCERPTVSSNAVRTAMACCLDADTLLSEYTGNFGLRNNGYYGLGQWMVQLVGGTIEPPIPEDDDGTIEEAWEEISLDELEAPAFDTEYAAQLLDEDGWMLNSDGIREKEVNGEKVTLDLKLVYPAESSIGAMFEECFVPYLKEAGIRLTVVGVEDQELLDLYHDPGQRDCDLIYLAVNFDISFNPTSTYEIGGAGNYSAIEDQELYELAKDMASTKSGEVLEYCQKWLAFQHRWLEVLPAIPLYTNVYFDFSADILQNYNIGGYSTWSEAIVESYLCDPPINEDEINEEDYELGDDDDFELEDGEEIFEDDF